MNLHFGFCVRNEARKLALGDVAVGKIADGHQYLEWIIKKGTKIHADSLRWP